MSILLLIFLTGFGLLVVIEKYNAKSNFDAFSGRIPIEARLNRECQSRNDARFSSKYD